MNLLFKFKHEMNCTTLAKLAFGQKACTPVGERKKEKTVGNAIQVLK